MVKLTKNVILTSIRRHKSLKNALIYSIFSTLSLDRFYLNISWLHFPLQAITYFNGDKNFPLLNLTRPTQRSTHAKVELFKLLQVPDKSIVCSKVPSEVSKNAAFIFNQLNLAHPNDWRTNAAGNFVQYSTGRTKLTADGSSVVAVKISEVDANTMCYTHFKHSLTPEFRVSLFFNNSIT